MGVGCPRVAVVGRRRRLSSSLVYVRGGPGCGWHCCRVAAPCGGWWARPSAPAQFGGMPRPTGVDGKFNAQGLLFEWQGVALVGGCTAGGACWSSGLRTAVRLWATVSYEPAVGPGNRCSPSVGAPRLPGTWCNLWLLAQEAWWNVGCLYAGLALFVLLLASAQPCGMHVVASWGGLRTRASSCRSLG